MAEDLLASRQGVSARRNVRIDGYLMDLSISESFTFPGEVTKFPAETGPDTSDHIRDLPPEIEMECVVSDTPSGDVAQDSSRQGDSLTGETPLPSEDALAKLLDMKARRRPVTIETSLGTFTSMACEEIEVSRDKDKNNALFFKAKFKKFVTVTNSRQRVRVKIPMPAGKPKGKNATPDPFRIDDRVDWRHGNPPGSTNIIITTSVLVQYNFQTNAGIDKATKIAYGRDIIGNPTVRYFDAENVTNGQPGEILGVRRNALVQDLIRDAREKRKLENRSDGAPAGVDTRKIGITDVIGSFGSIRGPTGGF